MEEGLTKKDASGACVVSYSLSGNNDALAARIAESLAIPHIRIKERKNRTMGTIVFDLIFNRTPRIEYDEDSLSVCKRLYVVGPIWMGRIASPFREIFEKLRNRHVGYSYITICGGADGPNPKLGAELAKLIGREPDSVVELYLADLLPPSPAPTRKDTMAYKLAADEVDRLTDRVLETISHTTARRSN